MVGREVVRFDTADDVARNILRTIPVNDNLKQAFKAY